YDPSCMLLFFLMTPRPPRSTLFPYTTLFRSWPPVPQNPRPAFGQLPHCGGKIGHLIADVMHAPVPIAFEEGGNRRIGAQRFEQFDLGVARIDEHHPHPVLGQGCWRGNLGAQQLAIPPRRAIEVGNGDGDVLDAPDHRFDSRPSILSSTANAASSTLVPGPKMSTTPAA